MPELDISYFTDTSGWKKRSKTMYNHLSVEDFHILDDFLEWLSAAAKGEIERGVNIVDFLAVKNMELNVLIETGNLVIVMFMEFFKYLENVEKLPDKYSSVEEFLRVYEHFSDHNAVEQETLMRTANWVNIILKYIPAKKNKGLIICIVPKYIEGLQTRYVTGSGQTHATNDRVHIYEVEGEVIRAHRHAPKKPRLNDAESVGDTNSVASGSVSSIVRGPTTKPSKPKRLLKQVKPLLDTNGKFKVDDTSTEILSSEGLLTIVAPPEKESYTYGLDTASFYEQSGTPVGDCSPYLKRTKLQRDITWGIDVNKKSKEDAEDFLFGFPPPHKSYNFAGDDDPRL